MNDLSLPVSERLWEPMDQIIETELQFGPYIYHPLPVVLTRGEGCYVWDTAGKRYLDMMSAYSAVSHGHAHPRLVKALQQQAAKLSVVSRAFYTDRLAPFLQRACELSGMDKALPMNTGVEAVETALKTARKWAYETKNVPADKAEVIVCRGNFHGRTITAIAMSSEPKYRKNFGPFAPGFRQIDFGDAAALQNAINPNTAAFLVEPIQGEGGIIVPPDGYLASCAEICRRNNVLLICDEIQTGLGRTGRLLASEHDGIKPDGVLLGKALGGGLYPVSMFLARRELLDIFAPGDHGSTFGGNALAATVGLEALNVLVDEKLVENSQTMGTYLQQGLRSLDSPLITEVRGRGLLIGIEIDPARASARSVCEHLMEQGILTKETQQTVVRLAPPLIIDRQTADLALQTIGNTLKQLAA
jgi:ornithine--oxo-acid transaminase